MSLPSREKKSLRKIAHHLHPSVIVGEQGLSDGVVDETERALQDHELIKVKLAISDRAARNLAGDELASKCGAEVVQSIGRVIVLYKANPTANAKLSNISRYR